MYNYHAIYNIEFSSYNGRFSQSRTNHLSIAMQGFTIADAEIHMPFHNSDLDLHLRSSPKCFKGVFLKFREFHLLRLANGWPCHKH